MGVCTEDVIHTIELLLSDLGRCSALQETAGVLGQGPQDHQSPSLPGYSTHQGPGLGTSTEKEDSPSGSRDGPAHHTGRLPAPPGRVQVKLAEDSELLRGRRPDGQPVPLAGRGQDAGGMRGTN